MCVLLFVTVRIVEEAHGEGADAKVYLLAGLVLFYLALTRPSVSLMPIPFAVGVGIVLWRAGKLRQRIVPILLLLLLLPLSAPWLWALRNQAVEGQRYYCRLSVIGIYQYSFVGPIAASEGKDPYEAMNQSAREYYRLMDRMTPQAMDRMYKQRILALLRSHPQAVVKNVIKGFFYITLPSLYKTPYGHYKDNFRPAFWKQLPLSKKSVYGFHLLNSAIEYLVTLGMIFLVARGSWPWRFPRESKRRSYEIVFYILLGFWLLCHITVAWYSSARFLLPMIPFIIGAAMVALQKIKPRWFLSETAPAFEKNVPPLPMG
jgi:4-amino-4-deoxy-L-arabinose transferase-like glycosyltransferase